MFFKLQRDKVSSFSKKAYIVPFLDPSRAKVLVIGFLANFGFGCLSFTLNYSLAGHGLEASLIYQTTRMAITGFLLIPLTFWLLSHYKSRTLILLFQAVGLGLFFVDPSSAWINSWAISIINAPFLALNHYAVSKQTSLDNRGNEASLYYTLTIFSYSIGLLLGGYMLQNNHYSSSIILSSTSVIIASLLLYRDISGRNNLKKVFGLIGYKKPSTRLTFLTGLFQPLTEGCMPIWMHAMGISALGAGINLSLRPLIGFALTPFVGWLVQNKGFKAGEIGGTMLIIAWLLMAGASDWPWMLSPALGMLTIGTNMLIPMEFSRWLRRRSSAAIISREVLIMSGRIPAYALGVFAAFIFPAVYPLVGLVFSGFFIFGSIPRRRGMGRRLSVATDENVTFKT